VHGKGAKRSENERIAALIKGVSTSSLYKRLANMEKGPRWGRTAKESATTKANLSLLQEQQQKTEERGVDRGGKRGERKES